MSDTPNSINPSSTGQGSRTWPGLEPLGGFRSIRLSAFCRPFRRCPLPFLLSSHSNLSVNFFQLQISNLLPLQQSAPCLRRAYGYRRLQQTPDLPITGHSSPLTLTLSRPRPAAHLKPRLRAPAAAPLPRSQSPKPGLRPRCSPNPSDPSKPHSSALSAERACSNVHATRLITGVCRSWQPPLHVHTEQSPSRLELPPELHTESPVVP